MTITVKDPVLGVEINLGQSDLHPGKTRVTIYATTVAVVEAIIDDLAHEYGSAVFTIPVQCADARWAAIGTVGATCVEH